MKHVFIVNKISGKGAAYGLVEEIKKIAEEKKLDYTLHITEYEGHAKQLASQYHEEDTIVYAVGGDGTILEVLNGLDKRVTMAIIPAGSGNDFYRYFDNGNRKDYAVLIREVIEAPVIECDYGISDRMEFLNTASFGLDGAINFDASYLIRNTVITKGPAYILSILKHIILMRKTPIRMIVDGEEYEGKYLIVAIMNGRYYGNGVKAAPNASIDDGVFDLVAARDNGRIANYGMFINYMTGKQEKDRRILMKHCKKVDIYSPEEMYIQCDGENFKSKELHLQIAEKGLKLKKPQ
ncbi:MAG: YegS/Rv2252/BmrU family lipid kinase [Erysipelotrichaceae bacterium]|nr:YegS/Rv2252/BmrU family lipid kinase [Erysipelotrichaceae bacterium]